MAYTVIDGKLQKVKAGKLVKQRISMTRPYDERLAHGSEFNRNRAAKPFEDRAHYREVPDVLPKNKGQFNGSCNRRQCLEPGASWYNRGSYAFYCEDCAHMLNHANRNDEFCKTAPLCYLVTDAEQAEHLHVIPSK